MCLYTKKLYEIINGKIVRLGLAEPEAPAFRVRVWLRETKSYWDGTKYSCSVKLLQQPGVFSFQFSPLGELASRFSGLGIPIVQYGDVPRLSCMGE